MKIASLGAIEVIIKAMLTHKSDHGVQQNASAALCELAKSAGSYMTLLE